MSTEFVILYSCRKIVFQILILFILNRYSKIYENFFGGKNIKSCFFRSQEQLESGATGSYLSLPQIPTPASKPDKFFSASPTGVWFTWQH